MLDTTFDVNADDTDADGETLTISEVRTGQVEGGGRPRYSRFTTLVGTYGTLTLNADGSYSYVADQDAANSLKEEIVQLIISTIQSQMEAKKDIGVLQLQLLVK